MNKIKNKIMYGILAVMGVIGLSSCEDFLTITPTGSIVEEDFWQDRKDLENAVYACYNHMTSDGMIRKFIQWGELRSDNFELRTGVSNTDIANVMNANLLPTNGMFSWTPVYKEINFCNKVLAHGPEIVARDESFSTNDWQPIRAEMLTLRALSHFYLVRTFERIPYITEDYNNDSQNFIKAQSSQMAVLDSIITDLELAKDIAMNSYGSADKDAWKNKGRITKKAVYALLADVYLWRASYKAGLAMQADAEEDNTYATSAASDYQRCIECCDWVIEQMKDEYKKSLNEGGKVTGGVDNIELVDLFIQNTDELSSLKIVNSSATGAYTSIFGSGNSRESIFEIQFDGTNNANNMLTDYFWNLSTHRAGTLVCSDARFSTVTESPLTESGAIFTKTDYRRWETLHKAGANETQTEFALKKYISSRVSQANEASSAVMRDNTADALTVSATERSLPNNANWIVYRLSDVVLMKAEAMSQVYTDEDKLKESIELVREVYRRSNPYPYLNATADTLNLGATPLPENIESLVMLERQREFVGEGKRWFDLVRYAQRRGSTTEMLDKLLTPKYSSDYSKAIKSKLAPMQALFSPIYTKEIKVNPLLEQNPVWNTTENTSKTDDL